MDATIPPYVSSQHAASTQKLNLFFYNKLELYYRQLTRSVLLITARVQ